MNEKKQSTVKRILGTRGMGAVITAFAGLIIIYVAFGLIDRKVFAGQNVMNLLRSMSKYLLIGVGQSYLLITGNIDLSIGSMVGMSAMISATLMAMGVNPFVAMAVAMASLPGYRSDQRNVSRKVQASAVHRYPGYHVRDTRRCLHGQQQPKHGCHRHRYRKGSRG